MFSSGFYSISLITIYTHVVQRKEMAEYLKTITIFFFHMSNPSCMPSTTSAGPTRVKGIPAIRRCSSGAWNEALLRINFILSVWHTSFRRTNVSCRSIRTTFVFFTWHCPSKQLCWRFRVARISCRKIERCFRKCNRFYNKIRSIPMKWLHWLR